MDDFSSSTLGNCPSYVWQSILVARPYLLQGIKWRIGNGRSVNIWEDKWLTTPHSFKLSSLDHLTAFDSILKVSQLINFERGVWKHDFIQQHFNSYEAGEILKIPLCYAWPRMSIFGLIIQKAFRSTYKLISKLRLMMLVKDALQSQQQ